MQSGPCEAPSWDIPPFPFPPPGGGLLDKECQWMLGYCWTDRQDSFNSFLLPARGQVLAIELPWLQNFKREALEGRCSPRLPTFSLKGSLFERGEIPGEVA